jgi:hypothetical protein
MITMMPQLLDLPRLDNTVKGYKLGGQDSIPGSVQLRCDFHSPSYQMGIGVSFPGDKAMEESR